MAIKVLGVCQKRLMTHQALNLACFPFFYTVEKVVGRAYIILHNKLNVYQFVL